MSRTEIAQRPYAEYREDGLILRDVLAVDRTVLANERTLLAYLRTALAVLIGGVSLIHFFTDPWIMLAGWLMIPFAPAMLWLGIRRFFKVRGQLHHLHVEA